MEFFRKVAQGISVGQRDTVTAPRCTSILLLFTPLALGSYYGLFPVLILIVVIIYRAIDEEQDLKQNLVGYKEYCEKVKYRLIPFIF